MGKTAQVTNEMRRNIYFASLGSAHESYLLSHVYPRRFTAGNQQIGLKFNVGDLHIPVSQFILNSLLVFNRVFMCLPISVENK